MEDSIILSLDDFNGMQEKAPPEQHKIGGSKEVVEYSLDGDYIACYETEAEASRSTGLSYACVSAICRGASLFSCKLRKIFLFRGDDIDERLERIAKLKKTPKNIYEYTLKGRLVGVFPSAVDAAKYFKVTPILITFCCKGRRHYIKDRIFLYKDGNIKERVKLVSRDLYILKNKRTIRQVDEYSIDGTFIRSFPTASAAAREIGHHVSNITRCCNGKDGHGNNIFTTHGRIFLWVGDSISDRLKQIEEYKNERQRLLSNGSL